MNAKNGESKDRNQLHNPTTSKIYMYICMITFIISLNVFMQHFSALADEYSVIN